MYGRKATGEAPCAAGTSPRLKIAGPLYSSSEPVCGGCWASDCAIRAKAQPKNRVVRTSSKGPPGLQGLDWRFRQPGFNIHSDAPQAAVSSWPGGVNVR